MQNDIFKNHFFKDFTKKGGYRHSCKICCQKYYYINQNRILNNHKVYSKNNRSNINAYERLKRITDFNFKLICNIRRKTNLAFEPRNIKKTNETIDLIGCSQTFLRKWILHQLYGDMTEDNYGKIWCLDHCLPLSKANLSNENDMYISTKWNNLGPMYVRDNIIKSDRIDYHLYLLQEVKAKFFMKINEKGLN